MNDSPGLFAAILTCKENGSVQIFWFTHSVAVHNLLVFVHKRFRKMNS